MASDRAVIRISKVSYGSHPISKSRVPSFPSSHEFIHLQIGTLLLTTTEQEIQELRNGSDLSLAVACEDSNVRYVKALIIGPPGTPYEYGFFDFAIHFTSTYPTHPPKVTAKTTNGGRTRFNPNIYANGKVCLSILGTWRGESGENWSSAHGLESVLLSIQSLMASNPYENEPGFENARTEADMKSSEAYIAKVRGSGICG